MENKFHLLVVDDDSRIRSLLQKYLESQGFYVSSASNAEEAKKKAEYFQFDLSIIDVMMPGISGIEYAKLLKLQNKLHPVILLTALSEAENRIAGLESGADDYITKPFEPRELLLRTKNLLDLYNFQRSQEQILHIGSIKFNKKNNQLLDINNQVIKLTSNEIELLNIFISNIGEVFTRSQIAQILGGVNERTVDVQITRLRSKIEEDPKTPKHLQTIRNKGYAFYV